MHLHAPKPNDPPYANYQAQLEGYKDANNDQKDQVEDYYAQIRKRPVERLNHSAETTEDQQLFVHVAPPPKPDRLTTYQSENSLDDIMNQPPEVPQR